MNSNLIKSVPVLCFLIVLFAGCIESQSAKRQPAFEVEELDSCLAIVVDMSGSYGNLWENRAHDIFLQLITRFFTEKAGSESRLVIGQLSGNEKVVLFEGRPTDLQARFRTPAELGKFLRDNADASSSKVFHATAEITEYMASMPGVGEETRLLTVILSDGINTQQNLAKQQAETDRMNQALRRYREKGGALALYFVAQEQTAFWQRLLADAGFTPGSYVVEGELVESPQLPKFE